MSFLVSMVAAMISFFHLSFNSWGLAIFLLALAVRFSLFPIQFFNFKQQKLMTKIQPELDEITQEHKEEPMKLYTKMAEVRKREGIKTGWSFLTSIVQIPLFISIYRAFSSLQSLMGGSFYWITSLGAPDPFYIFPVLVAVTTYVQQKNSPVAKTAANPSLESVMKFMPALSFIFMIGMPSGLVFYYAMSGALQILGDYVIRRIA
jgi:YidC/Oxa1 family membrane protein insertase